MLIKFSITVVSGSVVSNTEVTIDGDKYLIDEIIKKIKEIPGVEIK